MSRVATRMLSPDASLRLIARASRELVYDLPDELIGKIWKGKYRGQKQKWVLLRFLGADHQVEIESEHPEFTEWRWLPPEDLVENIVPFKRAVYEEVVARAAELANGLSVGHGLDNPDHTPVVSAQQLSRVEALTSTARQDGARVAAGGARLDRAGHFMAPTILADVDQASRVAQEEIFGPVTCITPFDTEAEAIAAANGTEFGLVAGIFTRDLARSHRVARKLRAGQVFVNEWFAGGISTPFGGVGKSGFGREKGLEALYNYVRTKNIAISLKG